MGLGTNHIAGYGAETDVFNQLIWSKIVIHDTEANLVLGKLVTRVDDEIVGADQYTMPKLTRGTAGDITQGTAVTFTANTETATTITFNTHKYHARVIQDQAASQAKYRLVQEYADDSTYAIKKAADSAIGALQGSVKTGHTFGKAGGSVTPAELWKAVTMLDSKDVKDRDRAFVLHPACQLSLMLDPLASEAHKTPATRGNSFMTKGRISTLFGIPVYWSTNVYTASGTAYNLLLQKEAIVFAFSFGPRVLFEHTAEYVGTMVVAHCLYGTGVRRNDHFSVIRSTDSVPQGS